MEQQEREEEEALVANKLTRRITPNSETEDSVDESLKTQGGGEGGGAGVEGSSTAMTLPNVETEKKKDEKKKRKSVWVTMLGCFSLSRNIPLLLAPVRKGEEVNYHSTST